MGGGTGGGNSTTNTVAQPWIGQIPYLTEAFRGAQDLYHGYGPQYPQYGQDTPYYTAPRRGGGGGGDPGLAGVGTQIPGWGQSPYAQDRIGWMMDGGAGPSPTAGPQYWPGRVTSDLSYATRTGNNLAREFANRKFPLLYDDLIGDQLRNSSAQRIAQMQGQYYGDLPTILSEGAQNYYGAEAPLNLYADPLSWQTQPQSLWQSEAVQRLQNDLSLGTSIQGINQAYQTPGIGLGVEYLNQANQLTDVNNPFLGALGEAATRDMVRQYQEKVLPGISEEAIGAGQFGGSRQAIAEGIAARGANENITDALARLYGDAYGQNLQAQTQRQGQGLQFLQGAAGQNLDYLQQGRGLSANFYGDLEKAAQSRALAGSQSLADFGIGIGGLANQRYGTNVGAWSNIANQLSSDSLDQQYRFAQLAPSTMQAGLLQSDVYGRIGAVHDERARAELENAIQRWDYEQELPWRNLERYFGIVGSNMGGGSSQTSTQMPGRSTASRAVGGVVGAAGGAYAGYTAGSALAGATVGSAYPVVGTVIGGIVGALAGAL